MSAIRHVLVLTEAWPPTSGGVATSAQRISRGLVTEGVKVTVFTFDGAKPITDPPYLVCATEGNLEILRFGPFFLKRPSDEIKGLSEKNRAVLRRQVFDQMEVEARTLGVDVIFSLYVVNAGWLATYLAHSLGVPHILGVRGNDIGRNIFSMDRLAPVALAVKNASAVVCVNDHLRERMLLAFPKAGSKTTVILNATEIGEACMGREAARRELLRRTNWPASAPWCVFIGTPREKKGIRVLLDAMALLPGDCDLKILCIGPEPGATDMRLWGAAWDHQKESGRLHCTGQLSRADALGLASGGDMVVMPSVEDGLANGLLEGMALGLCPIASELFADVLEDGKNGLLVRKGDAASLAGALKLAWGNRQLREDLGAAARRRVEMAHAPAREARDYLALMAGLDS